MILSNDGAMLTARAPNRQGELAARARMRDITVYG
jgi:hypothetical protein